MSRTHTHTHTHTHTLNTGLVQIWFPTKHWEIELFSERNTRTYGVFCLFKSATHTHFGYRTVRIWFLTEGAREIESWGLVSPDKGDESRQDSKEDFGKVVLESWYYTRRVVQRYSRSLRHNSREFPTGCCWAPIPRRRQRRSWRPGITTDTGLGVVLEAWCYTRAVGTEEVHVAAAGFQGIPDCVARYKFPRMWRRLD